MLTAMDLDEVEIRVVKARLHIIKARRHLPAALEDEYDAVLTALTDLEVQVMQIAEADRDGLDGMQTCRVCGCTDKHPCEGSAADAGPDVTCAWVSDDLCSACVTGWAPAPRRERPQPKVEGSSEPSSEG